MSPAPRTPESSNLLYRSLKGNAPDLVVGAKGVYLELADGTRILDACAGAAVASIGHGDERIVSAVSDTLRTLSYHHTSRLTNQKAEALADVLVGHRPGGLSKAIFFSSGSEAVESALKLARQYHVENGQPERTHYISRLSSYHGNGIGNVSLTGIPNRRSVYEPLLIKSASRVSACNQYRGRRDGESDQSYAQRLADELEEEILRVGPTQVAAFFAETVVGASGGCMTSVEGYFPAIRRVCDKYGVLLVLDEVMAGMGRTGKMHAWEWEGVSPDIQTLGKGLNGGYQEPLSALLMHQRVVDVLAEGTGAFINGHTFQSHPAAAAAGLAVMSVFKTDGIVANCAARGQELWDGLHAAVGDHPNVGEIRGRGLFLGIEFVADKATKATFPVSLPLSQLLDAAIWKRGCSVYIGFGKGCVDGVRGDHILLAPPLSITSEEVKIIVEAVKGGVEEVFGSQVVRDAAAEVL
ncbi:hypothetical protein JCM8547_000153 [Rhodosporidiobolus lusitaniae]